MRERRQKDGEGTLREKRRRRYGVETEGGMWREVEGGREGRNGVKRCSFYL